ncbi:MAG TPA: DUF3052 family protein [Candidatus Eremiobacteraceae bacterium]|nr:DUF3052 family protein [Candidatus Eremiobacteraceae bacterium]
MPGYSGTPLPKKLGIKEGFRVQLANAPPDVRVELRESLAGCDLAEPQRRSTLDFAMIFTKSRAQLTSEFSRISKLLAPAGMLWVSWPKKSSGVATDLDENLVRGIGLDAGLVDVKVCAVTEVWSGLKFVRRVKDRKAIGTQRRKPSATAR